MLETKVKKLLELSENVQVYNEMFSILFKMLHVNSNSGQDSAEMKALQQFQYEICALVERELMEVLNGQ